MPQPAPAAAPRTDSPGRLLIVDDLADNRAILSRRFERRGYEIVEADCGAEALRQIARERFDVVLLDVMMPDLLGTEVLRRIRETHSASTLPVIMVTAKSQSEDVVEALKIGANDYITKPVDFSVALARVVAQVERRRAELKLRDANADLETRISERSAKLQEANAAIRDEIERRMESESRIAYLAHHDTLTDLANRFSFDETLRQAVSDAGSDGRQLSVLFVDLDGFKNVNDTLGHAIGDALLKSVASKIRNASGAGDFCARLGGDEFAIVHLSDDARASGATLAQRIIDTLSGRHNVDGNEIYIGASVGVAILDETIVTPSDLLKQADLAMYRAKSDGRGVYRFFEAQMGAQAAARRALELDLRLAVEREEFALHYQPIVDLERRKVVSVEALMRWRHAERGFVSPADFIPLAEDTGVIVQLGEWALRRACADVAQWPGDIRVAVNLSPIQFRSMNLVAAVERALTAANLPPERLELEITEMVLLGANAQNLATLRRLRALGVRISLDDFGTGYSGLGYFREFQFDKVKIDQSFVRDMDENRESRAIVRAALGLGQNLGIRTTAEGVECVDQMRRLAAEGCNELQGYFFSRPAPASEIAAITARIESELA